jgi:hypothetical protein
VPICGANPRVRLLRGQVLVFSRRKSRYTTHVMDSSVVFIHAGAPFANTRLEHHLQGIVSGVTALISFVLKIMCKRLLL